MADASSVTTLAVVIAVGSTELKSLSKDGKVTIKPVLGGFILGAFLLGIASINNDLAVGFGVLIIVSSLLINGAGLFATANKVVTPAKVVK